MDLNHHFQVPTGLDDTWAHFQDVAGLAGCFPGAQVTSVDGDDFTGTCKVKLGPIALVYSGTGVFVERDADAHRMVVEAKGKDKRGNGTASAKATLTMSSAASGGTDVAVVTDLSITGKPAQFGRGLIQEVSDKLLGQFVTCLQEQLTDPGGSEPGGAEPGGSEPGGSEPESVADDGTTTSGPGTGQDTGAAAVSPPAAVPAAPSAAGPSAPVTTAGPPAGSGTRAPMAAARRPAPQSDDALDLGATVLPVLAKLYWKQAAGAGALLALVIYLFRRR